MRKIITTQFDLYCCHHKALTEKDACSDFLKHLVDFVGMRIIPEDLIGSKNPISFWFGGEGIEKQDEGVTGTITLYESHAAFHAWSNSSYVCVVLSSCKEYDPFTVAQMIQKYLCAEYYNIKL